MKITRIAFTNYRSLRDVQIALGQRTVLIGANGTGKTSILEALDKAFGSGRRGYGFREQDLFDTSQDLVIEFEIRPDDNDTFTVDEHTLFETHVDIEQDVEVVLIRVVAGTEDDGVFRTRGHFLKCDGEEDGLLDSHTRAAIGFFFLGAARRSNLPARPAGQDDPTRSGLTNKPATPSPPKPKPHNPALRHAVARNSPGYRHAIAAYDRCVGSRA